MDKLFLKNVLSEFPGKMITVNNHKIHVYTEGNGTPTLVFLSGGGTPSPIYDFKALFSKLYDEYQIAVIEKAGYGYSEITNVSRDIDTILFETRTVLKEANIEPPYILFPHSMSGIEALYWVQCFPEEILAIIGIDSAFPPFYEKMNLKHILKKMKFISKIINGKLKFLIPIIANGFPPIKYGVLNKLDKIYCKAIIYHRIITNDMINEVIMIKENSRKIKHECLNKVPMLLFVSNGKGTGFNNNEWEKIIIEYTKELNAEINCFNVEHYIHDILPEEISKISKMFINKILS